ncbi:MAG: uncharacterized protein KVP18_000299 [Porospora cf. gigantea A]|uniref:uncharacterized protein n=1 Tax=Porospora cf. gigantea A TaxID=2853593 RepID=UPI00355A3046|nr:MAG: hypothetical protein KVP18_000299 [Porospora cf. gigantea A]
MFLDSEHQKEQLARDRDAEASARSIEEATAALRATTAERDRLRTQLDVVTSDHDMARRLVRSEDLRRESERLAARLEEKLRYERSLRHLLQDRHEQEKQFWRNIVDSSAEFALMKARTEVLEARASYLEHAHKLPAGRLDQLKCS